MLENLIARRRTDLLSEITRRLVEDYPGREPVELLDSIPHFVDELEVALRGPPGAPRPSSVSAVAQGRQRHTVGLSPMVVPKSYGLICEVVSQLAAEEGLDIPAREVQMMNGAIDDATSTALDEYWKLSTIATEHAAAEKLGFLAHELRNALSTATMAFTALRSGTMGPNSRTGEIVERSLKRMDSLVRRTLSEIRRNSGTAPELQRASLTTLVARVEETTPHESRTRLSIDVQPDVEIEVDERLFESALGNLVQNALKFTPVGGQVVVRGKQDADEVEIAVEDECGGLGVDPTELFAPFVQRHENRTGVGLGLSITKESVESLGGRLEVRDLPGKGCVFAIRLPVRSR